MRPQIPQAAFDQATADEIAAERAYESSREVLRESTGDYVDDLVRPGEGMPLINPTPATTPEWVKLAMDQNLNGIFGESPGDRYTAIAQFGLPAAQAYDFGTSTSPLATGYTRVSEQTTYSVAQGFGWLSGTIDSSTALS